MKWTILTAAALTVATAIILVWLARPSLIDPDSQRLVSAIERNLEPPIPQPPELAPEQPFSVENNLEEPPPTPQTQSREKIDLDTTFISDNIRTGSADNFLSPSQIESAGYSPSQLENEGYMEMFEMDRSSYAGYSINTLVALAEAGDKQALLHASLRPSSLTVDQRKQYAIEAAKQGYTSALVGLGGQLLMPTKDASEKLDPDPVLGFALMLVAYEAGDAILRSRNTWAYMKSHLSARQQNEAKVLAHQLNKQIGTRP